jgi:hypothetical protein
MGSQMPVTSGLVATGVDQFQYMKAAPMSARLCP